MSSASPQTRQSGGSDLGEPSGRDQAGSGDALERGASGPAQNVGKPRLAITPQVHEAMRAAVLNGKTRAAVAKRFGCNISTVDRHTRGLTRGGPTAEQFSVRHGMRHRAQRLERLFGACNRALAEAR